MRPDTGRVSIEDLRADGVLLEVNRRVLNPVGLALTLDGPQGPLSIWRHGPGAAGYTPTEELAQKAAAFRAIEATEHQSRFRALGYLIQPLPGDPPRTVAAFTADLDGIWAFIEKASGEAAAQAATAWQAQANGDPMVLTDELATVLPSVLVAPLLGRLSLVSIDGGATYEWRLQPEAVLDEDGSVWARCGYLIAEIERLQFGGAVDFRHVDEDGKPGDAGAEIREYVQRAKGELYEHELVEFQAARETLDRLSGRTVSDETSDDFAADLDEVHATLERTYESAQPGMRVYRGDPEAREAFEEHRVRLKAAANSAVDRMTDYERLMSGELGDYEAADWPALDARVTKDMESATRACADAEVALRDAVQARYAAQRAMAVAGRALARVSP